MNRLQDKVAIVTGGAVGIGAACVQRMADEGAKVAILDRTDEVGQSLAEQLNERGHTTRYFHADVTSEAEVGKVFGQVVKAFGRLDVLVNNAGIAGPDKPTHELTESDWDSVQAVNVKGVFFCTKHAIAPMRKAGGGSIINLSSIYGLVGAADLPPYHASKGAVRLMSKTDALLYARDGIRVNSVHPGFIWTPLVKSHLSSHGGNLDEQRRQVAELHPLGHMGEPDDIAWGVVYLASNEAKFVTGSELVIDGGYTCR
ncbi:glucose 1-dehydrogenase [Oleiagrimonas sp. C23AA]|uniref:SDR family NAD(P)-dependent oxidoreductase n=1 Tax=Oleiagrimonas sp. C23AA TaxID=2719047 RepID=UPI00141F657D|nr:glucose 1-dehydrogenase [Oleiagrimonas sp. C23AA]NII10560.1 glucose 1-dehydrogenase [Oleiagrimonas sp. C23AA]